MPGYLHENPDFENLDFLEFVFPYSILSLSFQEMTCGHNWDIPDTFVIHHMNGKCWTSPVKK